jgi:tetratricopeptide (TPR) repeat protein
MNGAHVDIAALRQAAARFKTALQAENRGDLVAAARDLVRLDAPLGPQWPGAARALWRWGELELALQALDLWARQSETRNEAAYEKASLLARAGRVAEARTIARSLPAAYPNPVANAYLIASLALAAGDADEAESQFRRAIASAPGSGQSWMGLAQLGRLSDADITAMQAARDKGQYPESDDAAALVNALGTWEARAGNHEAAFAHFREAHKLQARNHRYNGADNRRSAEISMAWNAAAIAANEMPAGSTDRQPIFVTGLPRSGTTLVEQILSAHSQVDGGHELGLALQIEASVGGFAPADFEAYRKQGGRIDDLAMLYTRLVGERVPGSGRFVDKTLNQSRSIGPLAALFPQAPFIWMRRDPQDNALSIYRTWMANNTVSGWSLPDIADHMKVEDALFAHWTKELPDRILAVDYADLVENPREWTQRIASHCGLSVEEAQYRFHEQDSGVSTASAMQVRAPINREGLGVAQPYAAQMQPFVDAYSSPS